MGGIAPAPAAPAPVHGLRLSYTTATCLTAASVVVLLLYLTGRFVWLYNKDATAAAMGEAAASPPAAPSCIRAVAVSLLLVFVHMTSPGTGAAERSPECAVCLSEFRERETGRLLPVCGHGFHEECIVTWLRVNTSCPLCRAVGAAK